jgi:flagellar hook-basal body complex protein FliE
MASGISASNAYAAAARLLQPQGAGQGGRTGGTGSSFGDLVSSAVQQLDQTTRATDSRSQAMAAGRADLIDVVTAVAETEVAIETLVSLRDRVVQSYEEIMRMQI